MRHTSLFLNCLLGSCILILSACSTVPKQSPQAVTCGNPESDQKSTRTDASTRDVNVNIRAEPVQVEVRPTSLRVTAVFDDRQAERIREDVKGIAQKLETTEELLEQLRTELKQATAERSREQTLHESTQLKADVLNFVSTTVQSLNRLGLQAVEIIPGEKPDELSFRAGRLTVGPLSDREALRRMLTIRQHVLENVAAFRARGIWIASFTYPSDVTVPKVLAGHLEAPKLVADKPEPDTSADG